MRGTGKTVFLGDRIEDFQVEILGVLENIGPKQSLILARLSGGPLEHTGVLQGMSGSPVYIDGKLVGAVAMAFPFSKDPIAGIRPIEEMVRVSDAGTEPLPRLTALAGSGNALSDLKAWLPTMAPSDPKMLEIATPIALGGFTRGAIDRFAPQLRALGLEPSQGVSLGGKVENRMGDPSRLKPGSMISVELMTGDMSVGADGTVTYIDGEKLYAFGHRFLAVGPTQLPFARSEVMTLLPNLNSSFKISAPKELMGTISQDRNTAIAGVLGSAAALIPVEIGVRRAGHALDIYKMQMVNDRFLSPFLIQMAVFSSIDATERTTGTSSLSVRGRIEFDQRPPVQLSNIYSGDQGSAMQASLSAAIPLSYILQGGFDTLQVKRVALQIESFDSKKVLNIEQVTPSRREVHPGDTVELNTLLTGENGAEVTRAVKYTVPIGMPPGPLYFTVADGNQTSVTELRQTLSVTPRSADQLISTVNRLRANDKAYVRVWRNDPAFQIEGEDFPDPPPSLAMILAGSQTAQQTRNSKLTELEISAGEMMITGSKTVQVEVKD